ncbi:MAG: MATE family efflux transporter [Lachnospiraceae bacterium]|nr:MATE family efflux transporter [Lachnospiraceae bacterium]
MAHTKNMTEGKPFPIIFAYFIPVLCSTIFQQLYSIVDTIIVGKGIDDMALAAVGSTGAITFFIFGFIMGLGSGMAVLMAQAFGAGNYENLRKTITMGFLSCGFVAVIIMLLSMIVVKPVLVLLNTSPLILEDAILYITIIILGIPLTLLYNCLSAILSALGDSKTPLVAVVISTIINVVLDIAFIMGLHMRVEGAAIATLIAQFCSAIFCYMKLRKVPFVHLKKEDWKLDIKLIFTQFKIGIPVAFMNSVTAIGCLLLQYFVNLFGVNYTAAYSACSRITQFLMQLSSAVGMTISTYAGQNLGAGKIERIRQGLKEASKITIIITIFSSMCLIFAPRFLASIILTDPEIIDLSINYLRICGVMMWAIGFLFLVRSTLQGMGATVVPMISGFLELAARVLMILLLASRVGYPGIAIAEVTAWLSAFLLNGVFLIIKLRKLRKMEALG